MYWNKPLQSGVKLDSLFQPTFVQINGVLYNGTKLGGQLYLHSSSRWRKHESSNVMSTISVLLEISVTFCLITSVHWYTEKIDSSFTFIKKILFTCTNLILYLVYAMLTMLGFNYLYMNLVGYSNDFKFAFVYQIYEMN